MLIELTGLHVLIWMYRFRQPYTCQIRSKLEVQAQRALQRSFYCMSCAASWGCIKIRRRRSSSAGEIRVAADVAAVAIC
jgi:hypothetical protein